MLFDKSFIVKAYVCSLCEIGWQQDRIGVCKIPARQQPGNNSRVRSLLDIFYFFNHSLLFWC